ncbi:hypothetical protein NXY56_006556 [Leishmania guyanensis]
MARRNLCCLGQSCETALEGLLIGVRPTYPAHKARIFRAGKGYVGVPSGMFVKGAIANIGASAAYTLLPAAAAGLLAPDRCRCPLQSRAAIAAGGCMLAAAYGAFGVRRRAGEALVRRVLWCSAVCVVGVLSVRVDAHGVSNVELCGDLLCIVEEACRAAKAADGGAALLLLRLRWGGGMRECTRMHPRRRAIVG